MNNKSDKNSVTDWIFSDDHKIIKIILPVVILLLCSIYYNRHYHPQNFTKRYIDNVTERKTGFDACLYYVKIYQKGDKFYFKKTGMEFEILGLPEVIPDHLDCRYAIRGEIRPGDIFELKIIKKLTPRIYKLLFSSITAIIILFLFFVYFRYSDKGFIPRIRR